MANIGNCFRCFCLSLPITWTILTFIFVIFVLVGNTSKAPFPTDTYFLRMNVSMIDPPIVPPSGTTVAHVIGLHDFYQTGLWNFCEGIYDLQQNWRDFVLYCNQPTSDYAFDPIGIMSNELSAPYSIVFIQPQVDAINTVQNTSGWIKATFIITAIFTGFTVIFGPLTGVWHQRKLLNCVPVCTMCIAAGFFFMGAVSATAVYFQLRDAFNNDKRLSVQAHMGHQMFAFIWLGWWMAWVAAFQWCCAAICCPGGHRKKRITFKQPFHGFPAIMPWPGSDVRPDSMAAPLYQQTQQHGHHHTMEALGAAALAAGGLAAYEHHQHGEQVAAPPPPPPQEHHHGAEIGAATLAAGTLGAYEVHQQHQQHQQQQVQFQPAPPPPQQHHLMEGAAVGGLTAYEIQQGMQIHQQQIQQPQVPPPPGLGLEAAGGFVVGASEGAQLNSAPIIPPPIPILPVPVQPEPPLEMPQSAVQLGTGDVVEVEATATGVPVLPPPNPPDMAANAPPFVAYNFSMEGTALPPMVGPAPFAPQGNEAGRAAALAFGSGYEARNVLPEQLSPQPLPQANPEPPMPEPPVFVESMNPVVPPVLVSQNRASLPQAASGQRLPTPSQRQNDSRRSSYNTGPPQLQLTIPPTQNTIQPPPPAALPAPPVALPTQQMVQVAPPPQQPEERTSELWHSFPFGPAIGMVVGAVDALYSRDTHQA